MRIERRSAGARSAQLTFPAYASSWETALHDESLALSTRAALMSLDPRNITLEPEYYAECDDEKFQRVKPLLWLWYSYDRTVMGGQNVEAGVRLRRMLAKYIFKRCGERFKAFQNVEFSFGYNMEVGDDVVVHRNVLLDDRGGIVLGNKVSISRFREHLFAHAQHRRSARCHGCADAAGGWRARDVSRDDSGGGPRGVRRDGRRHGGGHARRARAPRVRRHSREERAGEANRAGAERLFAHRPRAAQSAVMRLGSAAATTEH